MKLRQHVYFGVWSDTLDPTQLAERIGVAPDELMVRGSRHDHPSRPVPRSHLWRVRCDEPGVDVGAQIKQVMERVVPAREALRELILRDGAARAKLQVVRFFGDEEGETEVVSRGIDGEILENRWLFGWALETDVLEFLVYVGAYVDVDEYDMLDEHDGLPAS